MADTPHDPLLDIRNQAETLITERKDRELVSRWIELAYLRGRVSGLAEGQGLVQTFKDKFHELEP